MTWTTLSFSEVLNHWKVLFEEKKIQQPKKKRETDYSAFKKTRGAARGDVPRCCGERERMKEKRTKKMEKERHFLLVMQVV